ncbi:MAG: branched-chain amino acid aminotransferase [Candidatus Heimdallarchaeota archaeon]
MEIEIKKVPKSKSDTLPTDGSKLGFCKIFTDHMFIMEFKDDKWQNAKIEPFRNLSLSPAALVLHYGQEIFEGMKAFNQKNNTDVSFFRPEMNAKRMIESAKRVAMEPFPEDYFLEALHSLVNLDRLWTPKDIGTSLYIRPTMIASEVALGLRKSKEYLFYVLLTPVGPYFPEGFNPIKIYVEPEYVRAVNGGIGESKTGGNYAASLLALGKAAELGCSQVLWLDAHEHKYVEEVGTMNQFFVIDDEIYTAPLKGTILKGVTRDSVITLAKDLGFTIKEEPVSIDRILATIENGSLTEAFGVGTAASIAPVGELLYLDKKYVINDFKVGPKSKQLYEQLIGIQYGKIEDKYGWNVKVKN